MLGPHAHTIAKAPRQSLLTVNDIVEGKLAYLSNA